MSESIGRSFGGSLGPSSIEDPPAAAMLFGEKVFSPQSSLLLLLGVKRSSGFGVVSMLSSSILLLPFVVAEDGALNLGVGKPFGERRPPADSGKTLGVVSISSDEEDEPLAAAAAATADDDDDDDADVDAEGDPSSSPVIFAAAAEAAAVSVDISP